jgi:hypothetical protein
VSPPSVDVAVIELAGRGDAVVAELRDVAPATVWREGSVPERRARAVLGSCAEAVLLIEDHVALAPGWLDAARAALSDPWVGAVSAPVRLAAALPASATAWALNEYAGFLDRLPGVVESLPGHLLLVRTAPVRAFLEQRTHGPAALREGELLPALRSDGWVLRLDPGLAAEIVGAPTNRGLRAQFRHGLSWSSGERLRRGWSPRIRALRACGWPAIAALRCAAALRFERRAPVVGRVAALSCAWALGEASGALWGRGDDGHWT